MQPLAVKLSIHLLLGEPLCTCIVYPGTANQEVCTRAADLTVSMHTCPIIDGLLQELVDEVPMSPMNLNPIKASLHGVSGPNPVQINQSRDF